jgi:hypothetical protein
LIIHQTFVFTATVQAKFQSKQGSCHTISPLKRVFEKLGWSHKEVISQSVSKSVSILKLKKGPAQSAEQQFIIEKKMYKSAESAQFHEQSFCLIDHQKEEKLT